jgi:hypothetical protein
MTKISFGYNQDCLGYGLLLEVLCFALAFFYPFLFLPLGLAGISLFLVKTEVHFNPDKGQFRFVKSLYNAWFFGRWMSFNPETKYSMVKYASATGMSMRGAARTVVRTKTFIFTSEDAKGAIAEIYEFTDIKQAKLFRATFENTFGVKLMIR